MSFLAYFRGRDSFSRADDFSRDHGTVLVFKSHDIMIEGDGFCRFAKRIGSRHDLHAVIIRTGFIIGAK